ncbi:hypothetical protein ZHAS_00013819 [Anopheles sinensis]|uniref:Uncharacterized protein n=1 Tax=Anopheles sinensis TaxID=74873 RepID=A0A084W6L7_ANOSI|nr:hypothetical protein ZHAS_00013819 [Anopheles sinensis]
MSIVTHEIQASLCGTREWEINNQPPRWAKCLPAVHDCTPPSGCLWAPGPAMAVIRNRNQLAFGSFVNVLCSGTECIKAIAFKGGPPTVLSTLHQPHHPKPNSIPRGKVSTILH